MYIHPLKGPLSGTTQVSWYQKGKTNLDFTEARDSEWQWHQLGRMHVCISLQTDNHASTPPLSFYRPDALPATQPTASKHWRYKYVIQQISACIANTKQYGECDVSHHQGCLMFILPICQVSDMPTRWYTKSTRRQRWSTCWTDDRLPQLQGSQQTQAPKLLTKSHILDADIQNLDCNVTLKCTVLYSPIP